MCIRERVPPDRRAVGLIMSDFYWGLIALGVAAVCGIQLHGWWMTRRSAPRQAEPDLLRPVDGDEAAQGNGLGPGAVDSEPDLGAMFDGATRFMVPEPARRTATFFYTHLRAHETKANLVLRPQLEKYTSNYTLLSPIIISDPTNAFSPRYSFFSFQENKLT